MRPLFWPRWLGVSALLVTGWAQAQPAQPDVRSMVSRAEQFLVQLFDPSVDLLPEFPGSPTYWLYHDNYLAAKVLEDVDRERAERVRAKIKSMGVASSGKIEILFGEVDHPLPFRQFELLSVEKVGSKEIRTERVTDHEMKGWQAYADLLALRVIGRPDDEEAKASLERLVALWDGKGFADQATRAHKIYATYKLALAVLAAERKGRVLPMEEAIVARLGLQQNDAGGFVTDYDFEGKPNGFANVETTAMVILALRAIRDRSP